MTSTPPAPQIDPRQVEYLPLDQVIADPRNPKSHHLETIDASIGRFGMLDLIVRDGRTGYIVSGHGRRKALSAMQERGETPPEGVKVDEAGGWLIPVVTGWSSRTDSEAAAALIALNRTTELGGWVDDSLLDLLEQLESEEDSLVGVGYGEDEIEAIRERLEELTEWEADGEDAGDDDPEPFEGSAPDGSSLAEAFGVTPKTVINTTTGEWRERQRAWRGLGIRSEQGREGATLYQAPSQHYSNWYKVKNALEAEHRRSLTPSEIMELGEGRLVEYRQGTTGQGTSIFDPALTELLYQWFSAPGDRVVDPWAGGSVRGVVAGALGRRYTGIELRPEQVADDREQAPIAETAGALLGVEQPYPPSYVEGDSSVELTGLPDGSADFLIGCPPYYDLEVYSDDPRDLSALTPEDFDAAMHRTLAEAGRVLSPDRFAAFVVGSVRDRHGHLRDMRRLMVDGLEAAGLHLYHDMVLVTSVGTAWYSMRSNMNRTRMVARTHQEVLIFIKGDRRRAAERLGDVPTPLEIPEEAAAEADSYTETTDGDQENERRA